MPSAVFCFDDFEKFIFQQVGTLERYDTDGKNKLSILFLHLPGAESGQIARLLEGSLRHSDALFVNDGCFFLVLPNTDKEGALHIVNVLEEFFKREIPEVILTYPEEAGSSKEMLEKMVKYANEEWKVDLSGMIEPY